MPGERIQRRIESLLDEADAPPYFPWIQTGNQWATLGGPDREDLPVTPEAVGWYEAAVAADDDPDPAILTALAYRDAIAFTYVDPRALETLIRALDTYRARGDAEAFARAVAGMPFAAGPFWESYQALLIEAIGMAGDSGAEINVTLRRKLLDFLRMGRGGWNPEEGIRIEADLSELLATHEEVSERSALLHVLAGYAAERTGQFRESARAMFEASQAYAELGRGNDAVSYLWIAVYTASFGGDLVQIRQYFGRSSH